MSPIPIAQLLNDLDKENTPPGAPAKNPASQKSRASTATVAKSASQANSAVSSSTRSGRAPSLEAVASPDEEEEPDEEKLGYLHRVTAVEQRPIAGGRQRVAPKMQKHEDTRAGHIAMHTETERGGWILLCLRLVGLHTSYQPGEISGPKVCIYFTGMGTKTSPCTVMTDDEFQTILREILRKGKKLTINVVFNVEDMAPWRIGNQKRAHADAFEPDPLQELMLGTQVPRVDAFSPRAQQKGTAIGHLKKQWSCATHKGEHGEDGFCWIAPDGRHVQLNNHRFDGWSTSMVDGEATKFAPPDSLNLDGNSSGTLSRPRGRTGPHPAPPPPSAPASALPSPDVNALLAVAMASLVGQLPRAFPRAATPPAPPTAPAAVHDVPLSPVPPRNLHLRTCLAAFYKADNVDARSCEEALAKFDIGPDIVPSVPVARLGDLTGLSEGNVMRLQRFCMQWQARLEAKMEKN